MLKSIWQKPRRYRSIVGIYLLTWFAIAAAMVAYFVPQFSYSFGIIIALGMIAWITIFSIPSLLGGITLLSESKIANTMGVVAGVFALGILALTFSYLMLMGIGQNTSRPEAQMQSILMMGPLIASCGVMVWLLFRGSRQIVTV
jgi:hypothetical protein